MASLSHDVMLDVLRRLGVKIFYALGAFQNHGAPWSTTEISLSSTSPSSKQKPTSLFSDFATSSLSTLIFWKQPKNSYTTRRSRWRKALKYWVLAMVCCLMLKTKYHCGKSQMLPVTEIEFPLGFLLPIHHLWIRLQSIFYDYKLVQMVQFYGKDCDSILKLSLQPEK